MKGLEEVVEKLREECKKAQVGGVLLKYNSIADFTSIPPENPCSVREKAKLFLSGTLPGAEPVADVNNLSRKTKLLQALGTIVSGYHTMVPHFRVSIKVASVGLQLPLLNVHNLRQPAGEGTDLMVVPAAGPGRRPLLLIFWKPLLDNYPSRELAKDLVSAHRELAGKVRVVSVALHCTRAAVSSVLSGSMCEDVEYFWMDHAETKRIKSTLTEIDAGAYFFVITNAEGKVTASGNPQEVVLKDEIERVISGVEVALAPKKPMEEIKEEDEGEEEEDEKQPSAPLGENEEIKVHPLDEEETKLSIVPAVKCRTLLGYLDAKAQIQGFLKEHLAEIASLRKQTKSFSVRLTDEYRCRAQDQEFLHHGTSVQIRAPVSEKRLPAVQGFFKCFETCFSQFLTVYTSGPVYGPFSVGVVQGAIQCKLCAQPLSAATTMFACLKCGLGYCVGCFFAAYVVSLGQKKDLGEHRHFLHFLPTKVQAAGDEVVPHCKKQLRRLAAKTPCSLCKGRCGDRGAVCFACAVCLTRLVLCQQCFMNYEVAKAPAAVETAGKELEGTHPHHDGESHAYVCIPC